MTKKKWIRWAKISLLVYLAGGVALYFLQDALLFHPVRFSRDHRYEFKTPHTDISIPLNEKDTLNLLRFASEDSVKRGAVLYFHGNKRNISWYAPHMSRFTRRGYEVYMIDYPGYGKSTGKLTEKKLYAWAALVYKLALNRFPADSVIIYGKSMGTGIAAQLASVRDCKRLILETPYFDFPSLISHYLPVYPVRLLLHYRLPTWQYLQYNKAPVHIIHGTGDWVISHRNAARLKKYLKPGDSFTSIRGGSHNNLFDYPLTSQTLDSLLLAP